MKSRFDSSRLDASLISVQWALRFVLILMAALALAACSDDPTGNNGGIASVQITAAASQVEAGDSVLLAAAPRRADGTIDTGAGVTWLSTDTSLATVQVRAGQKAVVRAKQPGAVRIHATAGNKTAEITVTVIVTQTPAPELDSIAPAFASKGSPHTEIKVRGKNFTELSIVKWNNVGIPTQFVSATELRAVVAAPQLEQVGTALVTVLTGPPGGGTTAAKVFSIIPAVANVRVEVAQPTVWVGEQTQLSAIPVDEDGEDLPVRKTQWQTTEPDILTVDANGVVTPVAPGLATVMAIVEGKVGSTYVYAVEPPSYDLMFESTRGGGLRELWITSLGANATPRRWLPAGFNGEDAATTRDGTRIAFVSRDQFLNSDIWVANRDGSGLTRLTFAEGTDDQPTWSPDGTRIAFRSTRAGYSDIWVMNADGSNPRNLTYRDFRVNDPTSVRPSWGVNGRIYFSFAVPSQTQLWGLTSVREDGSDWLHHSPAGVSDTDPVISWDGSTIALRRQQGNLDYGVIRVRTNGEALLVINNPGIGEAPTWARNDQWIAWQSSPTFSGPNRDVYVTRLNASWRKRITVGTAAGDGRNPVFIRREGN